MDQFYMGRTPRGTPNVLPTKPGGLAVVPDITQSVVRRLWRPEDLEMTTAGADGRTELWRYISPGTSAVTTELYPWEGFKDLIVWVQSGALASGTPTLDILLQGGMMADQDAGNTMVSLNTAAGNINRLTTSTVSVAFTLSTADPTAVPTKALGVIPQYWRLSFTASAAGVPFCVWVMGVN